ncbi:MAG: NADH-quinone oxidoreductase subunit C [Nitrospirae bacterium]|nr:NADH-quinone oxidoreductase subunit C [Nitrospirota bacterium]
MNTLKDIIITTLKEDAVQDEHQYPAWVTTFIVPRSRFVEAARAMKKADARLVAEWATDETLMHTPSPLNPLPQGEGKFDEQSRGTGAKFIPSPLTGEGQGGGELRGFGIFACFAKASEYLIVKTNAPPDDPTFPTLTKKFPASFRFERQIQSLMGVNPTGHPDNRPWIKHEDWPKDAWPLRKAFDPSMYMERVTGEYKFIRAEGIGVFEIPVGPVHAGIIEPGHFRFQAVGEDILNLEKKLGYVHKGIEKRFEALSWEEGVRLAGRVSGDTTVAHSLAYCMAVEAITMPGCKPPERGLWLRALMLERERIANHIGDIGGICNDAAFAFLLYQLSRLREIVLRTNYKLFGHRLMMDKVAIGGVSVDITADGINEILSELNLISDEFERLASIYDENPSLEDRVRDAGVLAPDTAKELGVVGITARASGQPLDCRIQNPFPPYAVIVPRMTVLQAGDVHSRTWVRVEEVRESIIVIRNILTSLPSGEIKTGIKYPAPDTRGFAVVEGWRGEIVYWIQAGEKGEINRCMVRDPSSVNWLAVEQAIHGNIVPDFPLCNKSFNQSYSGHDL